MAPYDAHLADVVYHIRELPEPPSGLAEFEQHVMAADAPAVVLIDRVLIRALLRYVRRLERDAT